jgi:limonene-1,2-epoxide hydrolase
MTSLGPSQAEAVVRRYLGAWVEPDPDVLAAFFSDDAVYIDGPLATHDGRAAISAEIHAQVKRFRSVLMDIVTIVSDGATVMTEEIDHFELAGHRFARPVAGALDLNGDGFITTWRQYYDQASIAKEIEAVSGAPPPPRT